MRKIIINVWSHWVMRQSTRPTVNSVGYLQNDATQVALVLLDGTCRCHGLEVLRPLTKSEVFRHPGNDVSTESRKTNYCPRHQGRRQELHYQTVYPGRSVTKIMETLGMAPNA